jgi:hypothetical protein
MPSRTSIIDGPGSAKWGSLKIFAQDGMEATPEVEAWRPSIATHGEGGPRLKDGRVVITLTPSGNLTAAMIAALYPTALRNPIINTSMHGASDTALELHSVAGKKVTFHNAGLAGLPELVLSPAATFLGQVTWNALLRNSYERATANSLYTVATTAWAEPFPEAEIISVPYSATWGTGIGDLTIYTENGWKVAFDVNLTPRVVDGYGTIDYKLAGITARASCQPVNLSEDNLLDNVQLQGVVPGASMRQGKTLTITGATGGLRVILYDAVLRRGPCQWGKTRLRAGEVGFEASRLIDAGDLTTLFAISIV